MNNDILEQLNEQQRKAVEYSNGPSLVIAGAGSGKTRVLTYKIAYLLSEKNLQPWDILALTFTNKAAKEMKERIGALVGLGNANRLSIGTFHSIFARILRMEAEHIGFKSNYTIYDESDSRSLIKNIVKSLGLDEKMFKPGTIHSRISIAKNNLITPHQYLVNKEDVVDCKVPEIYSLYQERLAQANAMDFDDLLFNTYKLFNHNENIRLKYSNRYKYILVDEYQDTNIAQEKILLQLYKEHKRICAVGDDAQSIYSFRGATIDNILHFTDRFAAQKDEDAKIFLDKNYRSTDSIVRAADSLIRHNQYQIEKGRKSTAVKGEGEKLALKPAYSDKEEAMIVCNEIKRLKRAEASEFSDFAILYRTNSQSRSFEEQMRKDNIPYRIFGGLSFYQRKEIKDILAYFRLVVNPDDEEALRRIINYPTRGIGETSVNKIIAAARAHGVSLWEIITEPVKYGLNVNKGTLSKIIAFRELIASYINKAANTDAYALGVALVKDSGISAEIFGDLTPEGLARQENLNEFVGGMQEFVEGRREEGREEEVLLTDFLQEVSLLSDLDSDNNADTSRVSLMTIHSAKGLEFPTVFIVGLEENIFPNLMASTSLRELEEERRLLYVAITRAEKHCILTCAQNRYRYGKMEFNPKSRFLNEIDPNFISIEDEYDAPFFSTPTNRQHDRYQNARPVATQFRADLKPKVTAPRRPEPAIDPFSERFKKQLAASGGNLRKVNQVIQQTSSSPTAPPPLSVGQTIEHERFGIGSVIAVEGTGENTKATVEFRNAGTKQLLLKFARFKVIS